MLFIENLLDPLQTSFSEYFSEFSVIFGMLTHPHWLPGLRQHAIWRQYTFDAKPTYLRIGLSDISSLNLNNCDLLFSLKRGLECSRLEKSKFASKLFKSFSRSSVCTWNERKNHFLSAFLKYRLSARSKKRSKSSKTKKSRNLEI